MAKIKKKSLINKVRTRVAPSPTGYPHVGTAFQALFDFVYARRYDGQFLIRIEDTDQKRYVEGAEKAIYESLSWLGLEADESPQHGGDKGSYRQSERLDIYQEYAKKLVGQGDAYYCFCSSERLKQVREKQKQAGQPPMYDKHCRNLAAAEVEKKLAAGEEYVIRLKVPLNKEIKVFDELRGEVKFQSEVVDDQVLLKSDGFPTYHLAVVVDDHLMGITHVVRGEEWLPSAPKHVLLYQYLGWQMPKLIHTPTLRNPDKTKLSKRKGNTSLWWYREHGYIPEGLLNFLGLLVWKPNEQTEIFSLEEMIKYFEWREMNVTGPVFDVKKLEWLNGKHLRQFSVEEFEKRLMSWADWVLHNGQDEEMLAIAETLQTWQKKYADQFTQALSLGKDRARTLPEIKDLIEFYFTDKLEFDLEDLKQGHEAEKIKKVLQAADEKLLAIVDKDYDAKTWEQTIRNTADELGLSHKDLFMSLRSAVTARKFTPPLYEVMQVLGRDVSSARIQQAIKALS